MSIVVVFLLTVLLFVKRGAMPASLGSALIGGGLAVAVVGFLDDHFGCLCGCAWRFTSRLLDGLYGNSMGWDHCTWDGSFGIGVGLASLVALFGLVWMINLYNFMDGIDGLAGSKRSAQAVLVVCF